MAKKRRRKIWLYVLGGVLLAIIFFIVYFKIVTRIDPPTELDPLGMGYEREMIDSGYYRCDASWVRENDYGLWELYIEGNPFELGVVNGILTSELVQYQEDVFVEQIKVMIPSESYLNFLKYFTAWFNKDLDTYIQPEYLLEIYGVSAFASENYGFIGDKYDRILNYHAAHDIGHALQNLNLVKCTAFGVWDQKSSDSLLLIGRNFDFYVGDEFARYKIVAFVNPDHGYKFASITWAGLIGVVSGMNEKGLTVSLNSAKSDIPFGARTPVSIIAREILQYASNIEEALAIASARESFVSESFLIGSAYDHKAVVIEKTSDTTVLYESGTNNIILTNHFQSVHFKDSPLNVENMENETSVYRHERVQELLEAKESFDHVDAAAILRDQKGKGAKNLGMGNEKAINQLIAHHSIIFKPEQRQFWISTSPWQLGTYLCYNLDSVFNTFGNNNNTSIFIADLAIPDDPFLADKDYEGFLNYRELLWVFQDAIKQDQSVNDEENTVINFIASNPHFFNVYAILGDYYQTLDSKKEAAKYYTLALGKEVSSADERKDIETKLKECQEE